MSVPLSNSRLKAIHDQLHTDVTLDGGSLDQLPHEANNCQSGGHGEVARDGFRMSKGIVVKPHHRIGGLAGSCVMHR